MTSLETTLMGEESQDIQRRTCIGAAIGELLAARYPHHTIKCVARDLRVSAKTAENLLAGHLSARTMTKVVSTYGLGILIDAGAAVTGTSLRTFILQQADHALEEAERQKALSDDLIALGESLDTRRARRSSGDRMGA